MTTSTRDDRETGSSDLAKLIAASGHVAGPRIEEFARLAAAVQLERKSDGASNTAWITRSTAMWALMRLDGDIGAVLARAGVDHAELGRVLTLRTAPGRMSTPDRGLHPDFADAVRAYLSRRSDRGQIDLVDLAIAIVTAARDSPAGLLPGRMRQLAVDYDVLLTGLNQLASAHGGPETLPLADFSGSVRGVRRRLGPGATVSAGDIGVALQAMHPEYGDGSFAKISFTSAPERRASVDSWLDRVHRRYDMNDVARSKHQVIDGELTLLGLATLDAQFAKDLSAGGFLVDLASRVGVQPAHGAPDRTQVTPDDPAERDLLGREPFATALVNLLKSLTDRGDRSNKSFLIHIDAPWGAGKSSILLFLKRQLRADGGFVVVEINAWREQRIGVPWWTILFELRRAVAHDRDRAGRLLLRLRDLWDRVRAGWVSVAVAVLAIGVLAAGLLIADLNLDSGGKVADNLTKIIALLLLAGGGVAAAVRSFLPNARKFAQSVVDASENPMGEVRRLFERAFGRTKKKVVFLVDDLDRCDAPYVVEFLEVMQTVVRQAHPGSGPYGFVAADGDWIRSSYQEHYESFVATSTAGRPLGYVFLEKIFQLHFRLPVITQTTKEAFFATLLTPTLDEPPPAADTAEELAVRTAVQDAESSKEVATAVEGVSGISDARVRMRLLGEAAIKLSQQEIQKETEHRLKRYSPHLEANPRSMILFVNTYKILEMLRVIEERTVDLGPLALWTLIEIRWPHLADYLRRHPDAVEQRAEASDGADDFRRLMLTKEVAAILAGESLGGPLTAELVGRCAGSSDTGDPRPPQWEPPV